MSDASAPLSSMCQKFSQVVSQSLPKLPSAPKVAVSLKGPCWATRSKTSFGQGKKRKNSAAC